MQVMLTRVISEANAENNIRVVEFLVAFNTGSPNKYLGVFKYRTKFKYYFFMKCL